MDYTKDSSDSELSIFSETTPIPEADKNTPNPRLIKALDKREYSANTSLPVDTSNAYITDSDNLPKLANSKNKKPRETINNNGVNKSIYYTLRFVFEAVNAAKSEHPNQELYFITCNISKEDSKSLANTRHGAVDAYARRLKERIKSRNLNSLKNFFFVLEASRDGSLHSHIVTLLDTSELDSVNNLLRLDTPNDNNSVVLKPTYDQKHSAKPGTSAWEFKELDEEFGLNSYTRKKDEWVMELPVNVGVADYLSKQLDTSIEGITGQHWYAPQHIKKSAYKLYEEAYQQQQKT